MAQNHILLLGAHGKISQLMIPLLLARSWSVTALIRDPKQTEDIMNTRSKIPSSTKNPGTLNVLVHSLADIKTSKDAASVIDKVKGVNWIVWSAGAGGKGGPEMTNKIDRDAAIAFAHAATHNDAIQRYLTVSACTSRRKPAPWWNEDEAKAVKQAADSIAVYTQAKLDADECLTVWGEERRARDKGFKYVVLRPGMLSDDPAGGKVQLGHARGRGKVPREDVAVTAVEMLENGANGWFDLLEGEEGIQQAVRRVMETKEMAIEGESVEEMKETAKKFSSKW